MDTQELNLNEMAAVSGGTGEDARYIIYTVQKGDSLYKIAKIYGVSVEDLVRWNGIKNKSLIQIDQEIKIYL